MTSSNFTIKTVRSCPEQVCLVTRYYSCAFAEVHHDVDGKGISVTAFEATEKSSPLTFHLNLDGNRQYEEISVITANGVVVERITAQPPQDPKEFVIHSELPPKGPIKRMPLNETGGMCRGGSSN